MVIAPASGVGSASPLRLQFPRDAVEKSFRPAMHAGIGSSFYIILSLPKLETSMAGRLREG